MLAVESYPSEFMTDPVISNICRQISPRDTIIDIGDTHDISSVSDSSQLSEPLDIDHFLVSSFRHLMTMYQFRMQDNSAENGVVFAGGLQQYLIRQAAKEKLHVQQPRKCAGTSDTTTFHDLPDSLQLEIFSYLDSDDLCRICSVCRHWHIISSDDLLWERRLAADVRKWSIIGHTTNPGSYSECQSDWSPKEVYIQCSPEVNEKIRHQNYGFHQLSTLLRSVLPARTPKIAMFGPGLELDTSGVVRKIIHDEMPPFKRTGMFPGQFSGYGGGFTLKMGHNSSFHLTTLYTNSAKERSAMRDQSQRRLHNRMLVQEAASGEGDDQEPPKFHVQQPIKDLCCSMGGFIFAVCAHQSKEEVAFDKMEMNAMLEGVWADTSVPVLVLCLRLTQNQPHIPCIDVVEALELGKLSRPWQAHDCIVEDLTGIVPAFQWVIGQAQRR